MCHHLRMTAFAGNRNQSAPLKVFNFRDDVGCKLGTIVALTYCLSTKKGEATHELCCNFGTTFAFDWSQNTELREMVQIHLTLIRLYLFLGTLHILHITLLPARQLRSSTDTRVFRIPSFRTKSSGQRSFSYQAPVIFNQLPVPVRHSTSASSFKSALKTFLFLKTFSSVSLP